MAWQRWRSLIGLPTRAAEHARNLAGNLRWLAEVDARQIQAERRLFDRVRVEPPVPSPFPPPTPGPDVLGPIREQRKPIQYLNLHLPDGTTIPIIPLLRLPLLTPGTWTNDDPGAGSVSWSGCQVAHEGEIYEITDGNTALKYIWWDYSNPTVFQTTDTKPTIDPREDILVCYNDNGTAELAFLANLIQAGLIVCQQLDVLSAHMGLLTAGEIRLGTGTPGVDFTGIRIYKDGATYRVAGYSGDALQAYIDSDGKLKAGNVTLDVDGITIAGGSVTSSKIEWKEGGAIVAGIYADESDTDCEHYLVIGRAGIKNGYLDISCLKAGGGSVRLWLSAALDEGWLSSNLRLGGNLRFVDSNTEIWEDASSNLSFKDANAGTKILSELQKGLDFIRADKDGDGDFDPLTAAAWENSTKSGAGTINWNTVFGVPTAAKMVKVVAFSTDAAANSRINFAAKSTTTNVSFQVRILVANQQQNDQFDIPIAADGTSYYNFLEAFDSFFLRVIGWYV